MAKSRLSVNWKYKKPFPFYDRQGQVCYIYFKFVYTQKNLAQNRRDMGSGPVSPCFCS